MCGWRVPSRISVMSSPEPIGIARTKMRLPPVARWSSRLNLSVTSVIQRSFSEPHVNSSSMESGGAFWLARSSFSGEAFLDLHPAKNRAAVSRNMNVERQMLNGVRFRKLETTRLEPFQRGILMIASQELPTLYSADCLTLGSRSRCSPCVLYRKARSWESNPRRVEVRQPGSYLDWVVAEFADSATTLGSAARLLRRSRPVFTNAIAGGFSTVAQVL